LNGYLVFQNIILMTLQSALLSFSYYGACHAVSVVWFASNLFTIKFAFMKKLFQRYIGQYL